MSEETTGTDGSPEAESGGEMRNAREAIPIVGEVAQKTSRFSREFVATMISLASAAFGVVAALAWNTAITSVFTKAFAENPVSRPITTAELSALFIYAVVVTLIGVTVIVLLGRLATRINAQPVEFKYPSIPRS